MAHYMPMDLIFSQYYQQMPRKDWKQIGKTVGVADPECRNGFVDNFFYVSSILDERRLPNGREQVFVSWQGWPSKYNSWVYKETVMPLVELLNSIQSSQNTHKSVIYEDASDKGSHQVEQTNKANVMQQWKQYINKKQEEKKKPKAKNKTKKQPKNKYAMNNSHYKALNIQTSSKEGHSESNSNSKSLALIQKEQNKKPKMDIKLCKKQRKQKQMVDLDISKTENNEQPNITRKRGQANESKDKFMISLDGGEMDTVGEVSKISMDSESDSFIKMPIIFEKHYQRTSNKQTKQIVRKSFDKFSAENRFKIKPSPKQSQMELRPKNSALPKQPIKQAQIREPPSNRAHNETQNDTLLIPNTSQLIPHQILPQKTHRQSILEQSRTNLLSNLNISANNRTKRANQTSLLIGNVSKQAKGLQRPQQVEDEHATSTILSRSIYLEASNKPQSQDKKDEENRSDNSQLNRSFCQSKMDVSNVTSVIAADGNKAIAEDQKVKLQGNEVIEEPTHHEQEAKGQSQKKSEKVPKSEQQHQSKSNSRNTQQQKDILPRRRGHRNLSLTNMELMEMISNDNSNTILFWQSASEDGSAKGDPPKKKPKVKKRKSRQK